MMEKTIVQQTVQEALAQLNRNVVNGLIESRRRSGSTPNRNSSRKMKESDLVSITTMAGTQHTHSSARKIEEVGPDCWVPGIDPEENMREESAWGRKETGKWSVGKNGAMSSTNIDISTVKYYFIKTASQNKMVIMRDLDNIVTVKSNANESIGCFLRYCLPIGWDRSVYQLERTINSKGSKVKIALISGNQFEFEEFKRKMYYDLWENGVLELEQSEAIKLVCFVNKELVKPAKKAYQKAYAESQIKNLDTIEEVEKWEFGLMAIFKQAEEKLYNAVFQKSRKIPKTPENIEFLSEFILSMIPIEEFYIKSKMQQSKKIQEIRKQIQNDMTIGEVFKFLEVQEKFAPFIKSVEHKSIKRVLVEERGFLPFHESLQAIEALNFGISPMRNLKLITQFTNTLLETYRKFCECAEPMLDMDSQLPLTIYCILGCSNPQLKALVSLLGAYLENEDSCENEKRTLAALNASLDFVRSEWNERE